MVPDDPTTEYIIALTLTLLIETPIVARALTRWYRVSVWWGVAVGLLGSLLTHPVVWFVLPGPLTALTGRLGYLLIAEGFAWLVEATVYWLAVRRLTGRRDVVSEGVGLLLLSLLANFASFSVGALLLITGLW